jgi:hydroxymethylpyrimidine/phosphomethylpyrimidine kinase
MARIKVGKLGCLGFILGFMRPAHQPIVVTIAGSDSGGEAGVQGDLQTFFRLGVHGTTAITCLTAQNPGKISRVEACPPVMLRAQLQVVAAHFKLGAAKTGMLFNAAIVGEVARFIRRHPELPLVVDPVLVSTSGRRLLQTDGVQALQKELLPLAAIVTPNLDEAELLTGRKIRTLEDLRAAARAIHHTFGCDALVKGGHLPGTRQAVDFFHGRDGEWMLAAPRIKVAGLHGTGCAYSAAITAWLARGKSRLAAVTLAKEEITRRIDEVRRG